MTWDEFMTTFLERFFPRELREAKAADFINLRQNSMTVQEYALEFTQLSKYALEMVTDQRAHVSRFVNGVVDSLVKKCRIAMLHHDIDFSRLVIYA